MKTIAISIKMFLTGLIALTLVCCSSDENEDVAVCPVDGSSRAVFSGSTDMAFPLYKRVSDTSRPDENFMVSPLSLTEVLAMLVNGAEGETQKQILDVMNIGALTPAEASRTLGMLNDFLDKADKSCVTAIANSQWIDKNFNVKTDFITKNEKSVDAETFIRDLATTSSMNDINSWCDKRTNGKIKNLLSQPLDDDTRMLVVSALYFKGVWQEKFDKKNTTTALFTNSDSTTSSVQMMRQQKTFLAWEGDDFDMAEFPYGNGSFCMDVVLPHAGKSLDHCMQQLGQSDMAEIYDRSMEAYKVDVCMPRMELNYHRALKDDLASMGMQDVFDAQGADFSGIADRGLYISQIKQVTSLKIDENGTEAAAATHSQGITALPFPSLSFNMNRPFAFMIRERQTGIVLFIGRMVRF